MTSPSNIQLGWWLLALDWPPSALDIQRTGGDNPQIRHTAETSLTLYFFHYTPLEKRGPYKKA